MICVTEIGEKLFMNKTGKRSEIYLKRSILVFIGIFFCICVLILAQDKYGILDKFLMSEEIVEQKTLITKDAEWLYFDDEKDPGVGNVWTTDSYDDSDWKRGVGAFVKNENLSARTADGEVVSTYFFRKEFQVQDVERIKSLDGIIEYKDAAIVYLNGTIVYAGNVPAGGYENNQDTGVPERKENPWKERIHITDLSSLQKGENILAVEIHQESSQANGTYFALQDFFANYNYKESNEDSKNNTQSLNIEELILEQGQNEGQIWVNWQTNLSEHYKVEYMDESSYESMKSAKETDKKNIFDFETILMGRTKVLGLNHYCHKAPLERLKSGTKYYYRIVRIGGNETSEYASFETKTKGRYSFAVLGDPQIGAYSKDDTKIWQSNMETGLSLTGKVDFIASLGDQVDGIGDEKEIYNTFVTLRSPKNFRQIPLVFVRGNHEAEGIAKDIFDKEFISGDYYFTYGDTLFLVLDSNDNDLQSHEKFIRKTIEQIERKWIVVFMHHSLFSGGKHAEDSEIEMMRTYLEPLFKELPVDLVMSGHDHIYTRSQRGNTYYISAGSSSGNKFYEEKTNNTAEVSFMEPAAIIMKVEVGNNSMRVVTYRIDTSEIVDDFVINKN